MKIDTKKWQYFKLAGEKGLFDIQSCKCNNATELLESGNEIEYYGAKKNDNCFMRRVMKVDELVTKGNCIIFICDGEGSVGYTNYAEHDFIGSTTLSCGYNAYLNKYNAMFLVTVLDKERFRYSYGRKYKTNLDKIKIKLPATIAGEPDWQFMEDYIKGLHHKPISTSIVHKKINVLTNEWKLFKIEDLFYVKYGINMELDSCVLTDKNDPEGVAFVARTSENNGISAYVKKQQGYIPQNANVLTIAGGGSVLSTFYQSQPFYSGRDLYLLLDKKPMSRYSKLFIKTVIEKNKYRYSYGRQANKSLPSLVIALPVDKDGEPNFHFMEECIKSLPYSDRI